MSKTKHDLSAFEAYRHKPTVAFCLVFDGTNGKKIVEEFNRLCAIGDLAFHREGGTAKARNGGKWVRLTNDIGESCTLRKGDALVLLGGVVGESAVGVLTEEDLAALYKRIAPEARSKK